MQTPEQIAEQLVADWQAAGKMPPMAWDFRGFAADAARRAEAAHQGEVVAERRDLLSVILALKKHIEDLGGRTDSPALSALLEKHAEDVGLVEPPRLLADWLAARAI